LKSIAVTIPSVDTVLPKYGEGKVPSLPAEAVN